jgi:hypothetical protein
MAAAGPRHAQADEDAPHSPGQPQALHAPADARRPPAQGGQGRSRRRPAAGAAVPQRLHCPPEIRHPVRYHPLHRCCGGRACLLATHTCWRSPGLPCNWLSGGVGPGQAPRGRSWVPPLWRHGIAGDVDVSTTWKPAARAAALQQHQQQVTSAAPAEAPGTTLREEAAAEQRAAAEQLQAEMERWVTQVLQEAATSTADRAATSASGIGPAEQQPASGSGEAEGSGGQRPGTSCSVRSASKARRGGVVAWRVVLGREHACMHACLQARPGQAHCAAHHLLSTAGQGQGQARLGTHRGGGGRGG